MANIEIDGKKIEADSGMMIIEACDAHHIPIPRFCYHKKLSIAANCRMCLVEVEKSPKPLPACATPITDGMKIWTQSKRAIQAQKNVMEFLLINHPLDCPICDQGGECELQDISMGYGNDFSRFNEKKRVVADENLGSLISTDMTRCIQCTRCVRFGSEIAGMRELGAVGRGEHMEIKTFIEKNIDSEVSGNVIELCPVGALTSKPYRFTARGFELQQKAGIAPHDCIGSNINIHVRRNKVMRVVPRENETINEIWISDRDRYSYTGLYHERLALPKIKQSGKFEAVSWSTALNYAAEKLKHIVKREGPESIGALLSPNTTTEEAYLLQKWMRGLGSPNIDHRLRQLDFRGQEFAPAFPNLGLSLPELENQSLVLLVGSLTRQEQPSLALKLRKMTLASGKVMVINPLDCPFNFDVQEKIIVPQGDLVRSFLRVLIGVLSARGLPIPLAISDRLSPREAPTSVDNRMAEALIAASDKAVILLGALSLHHPEASNILAIAHLIREVTGARLGTLTEGANAAGSWLSGAIPHRLATGQKADRVGLNAREMWQRKLKAYILFGLEPVLDCAEPNIVLDAMASSDFVLAITPFENRELEEYAEVLLPSTPFTETSGTFINASGIWQTFQGVVTPYQESRPGWKIVRVLANLCDLPNFDYQNTGEILTELKQEQERGSLLEAWEGICLEGSNPNKDTNLIRIAPVPLYATDNLVRRALPLQNTQAAGACDVRVNLKTLERLGLQGHSIIQVESQRESVVLPLVADDSVPENVAVIPAAQRASCFVPAPYEAVTLKAVATGGDNA